MKTKMNEMNKKAIKFINSIALTLVLSMTVLVPCQNAVGTVPDNSLTANSSLINGTETIVNPGLRLSGEEMYVAHKASNSKFAGSSSVQSATADDCNSLMAEFKAKIKVIESLRCATDDKSKSKRDKAVAEAEQLIGDMQSAGCPGTLLPGGVAKLELMIAQAASCHEEDEDGISGKG